MKIKPMLARLQDAIGSQDILEQMVLLPESAKPVANNVKSSKSVNLVVGYDSSPNSQTALDIALLIAHQTRLASQKQVTVHVVYVLDDRQNSQLDVYSSLDANNLSFSCDQLEYPAASTRMCAKPALTQNKTEALIAYPRLTSTDLLEQADQILWQARCLAEEWKGTFVAHLRFGYLSYELRQVVASKAADLLLLGCDSKAHPVVQQLGANFPCAVLGIPTRVRAG